MLNKNKKKILNNKVVLYASIITLFATTGCVVTSLNGDDSNTTTTIYSVDPSYDELNDTVTEDQQNSNIHSDEQNTVDHFIKIENDIANTISANLEEGLKKTKEGFITIVDFVFYDSEINGVTFNELSDDGKEKVLEIISKIDNTVEIYYPSYKVDILNLSNQAADSFFDLVEKGKNNINDFAEENIETETLDKMKDYSERFNNTIDSFTNSDKVHETYEAAKDKGQEAYDYTKEKGSEAIDKLDDWYQNFKK